MAQPTQTNSCTFWIQHSEGADRLKQGTTTLVFALATIALIGGALAIMAQQGVPLAGINSLAGSLSTTTTYLSMVGIGAVWIGSIVLLVALAHSHRKAQFSEAELQTLGVRTKLDNLNLPLKISPKQYWCETYDASTGNSPSVFALVTKDRYGKVHQFAYHTSDQREAHIRYYLGDYTDGKAQFEQSPEYPTSFGQALVGGLQHPSPDRGTCEQESFEIHGLPFHVLTIHTNVGIEVRYCKTSERVDELLSTYYSAYLPMEEIREAITRKQPPFLKNHGYWALETTVAGDLPLYLLYLPDGQALYFTRTEERTAYIKANLTNFANLGYEVSVILKNHTQEIYNTHHLGELLQENELYQGSLDIEGATYHLLIDKKGQYRHSTTPLIPPSGYQVTIVEDIDQVETSPLHDQLDFEEDQEIEDQKEWIDENSYVLINHHQLFSVVFDRDSNLHSLTFTKQEARDTFIKNSLSSLDMFDPHDYLINKFIDEELSKHPFPEGFYVTPKITYHGVEHRPCIFIEDGDFTTTGSPPSGYRFLGKHLRENNGRLPQEFGEILAERVGWSKSKLETYEPQLLKGEYWSFKPKYADTEVSLFSKVYPLITRDENDQIDYHYFLTYEARRQFCKDRGLNNGFRRHKKNLEGIFGTEDYPGVLHPPSGRGSARNAKKTFPNDPKVTLKCWYDPHGEKQFKYTRI